MAIETHCVYMPQHALPVYVKLTDPRFNDYKLWETYEIRYDGEDEDGFNYAHEAMLVGRTECEWGEVEPMLIALLGHSRDMEEAVKMSFPTGSVPEDDRNMAVLTFLRLDKTKEFVLGDTEPLGRTFTKEDAES